MRAKHDRVKKKEKKGEREKKNKVKKACTLSVPNHNQAHRVTQVDASHKIIT